MQNEEFNWFESVQDKLADAFLKEGYDTGKAHELGFLVAQSIRDVPSLLRLLDEYPRHLPDEILDAVHMVLANRSALNDAAGILFSEK